MNRTRDVQAAYERILRRVDDSIQTETNCLICTYSTGSHGYPQAWDGTTVVLAHRIVWEAEWGPIPKGMTVDHICHVRTCVSLWHLRLLSNFDNARRNGPGDWPLDGRCKHGHPVSDWRPLGPERQKGYCAACRLARRQGAMAITL